jgi:hypothetical protein
MQYLREFLPVPLGSTKKMINKQDDRFTDFIDLNILADPL